MAEEKLIRNPKLIIGEAEKVEAEVVGADDIVVVTDEEFYTSKQIDELLKKSGGASLPILTSIWSDHLLNDISWLRADTFSWQSGDVYVAAYNHLANEFHTTVQFYAWEDAKETIIYTTSETPSVGDPVYNADGVQKDTVVSVSGSALTTTGAYSGTDWARVSGYDFSKDTSKNETIGDITITYYLAEDGHKICLPDQESNIVALYEKTGAADYYLLDTTNKQFKLPRKQKRTLIQAVKNTDGTWYNLYSDGWVEQGRAQDLSKGANNITLPIPMADTNYMAQIVRTSGSSTTTQVDVWRVSGSDTTTTICVRAAESTGGIWYVCGYAAESAYASAGMNLEYYYVGNFSQEAIEQTAGLNAELFNNKADIDLGNIPANYDYVIESQQPTADNGYTWYRLHKSGWVEQGGETTTAGTITLPVEMSDTHYTVTQGIKYTTGSQWSIGSIRPVSTTTVSVNKANGDASWWRVCGMSMSAPQQPNIYQGQD